MGKNTLSFMLRGKEHCTKREWQVWLAKMGVEWGGRGPACM